MDSSFHDHPRLWEGPTLTIVHDAESWNGQSAPGPHNPAEFAERLYAQEAFDPPRLTIATDDGAEPYSLQWFLSIESHRHGRQGRWIPHLMEFAKHTGETLLGLGDGLGTDWLQYARHGASVVVCSPSSEQLSLIRRNFELRGLGGRFLRSAPVSLPLEDATIDVACLSGLLHEVSDPSAVIQEVYRVLKPGGKVLATAPARFDVDYWQHLCFPWKRRSAKRRAAEDAAAVRFTARDLRRLFADFIELRVHKRQLRRSEVPHVWRWLPMPLLERLLGHVLVLKGFKSLSAALGLSAAA